VQGRGEQDTREFKYKIDQIDRAYQKRDKEYLEQLAECDKRTNELLVQKKELHKLNEGTCCVILPR
jgi:hypothetical protein